MKLKDNTSLSTKEYIQEKTNLLLYFKDLYFPIKKQSFESKNPHLLQIDESMSK